MRSGAGGCVAENHSHVGCVATTHPTTDNLVGVAALTLERRASLTVMRAAARDPPAFDALHVATQSELEEVVAVSAYAFR